VSDYPTLAQVQATNDLVTLLRWYRFLPSPDPGEQVTVIDELFARCHRERKRQGDAAWVAASKQVGWR
jgi:hypothetical protein